MKRKSKALFSHSPRSPEESAARGTEVRSDTDSGLMMMTEEKAFGTVLGWRI